MAYLSCYNNKNLSTITNSGTAVSMTAIRCDATYSCNNLTNIVAIDGGSIYISGKYGAVGDIKANLKVLYYQYIR